MSSRIPPLDLTANQTTDAELAVHLAGLNNLSELYLKENRITDAKPIRELHA